MAPAEETASEVLGGRGKAHGAVILQVGTDAEAADEGSARLKGGESKRCSGGRQGAADREEVLDESAFV
jgi:hypothetical protein